MATASTPHKRYRRYKRPPRRELALLGEALTEWDDVEFAVKAFWQRLAGMDTEQAHAVLAHFRNWRTLTDSLRDMAEIEFGEHDDAKKLNKLLDRADKLALRRNNIVHASWLPHPVTNEWCRYTRPRGRYWQITLAKEAARVPGASLKHFFPPAEIRKFCDDAAELESKFWDFWAELYGEETLD
jgi:hypothetical protein